MSETHISTFQAVPRGAPAFVTTLRESAIHETVLLCTSLVLLVLSTDDPGMFGLVVRLFWLASFAWLAFLNIGSALAVYVGSLAVYFPLRDEGWSTLLRRPDNYALAILFVALIVLVAKRQRGVPRFALYILPFVLYCSLNTAILAKTQYPALMRILVVPALLSVILSMARFRKKEINAFLQGMAFLGCYMGFVSICEGFHVQRFVLPHWIGDPSILGIDPDRLDDKGRAGGVLMGPALNGLLLSLILMMLFPLIRRGSRKLVSLAMLLCAAGAFFTLERAVWLGLLVSLFIFSGWFQTPRQIRARRIGLISVAIVFVLGAAALAGSRLKDSDTILYRFALWGAGMRIFMAHPITGIGFYNFPIALGGVQQGFGSALLSYRTVKDQAASHNTMLTILVEFGFAGLLFFTAAYLKVIQAARTNALRIWGPPGARWALAFVVVYMLNAQFISVFEGSTSLLLFGMMGIIAGADA